MTSAAKRAFVANMAMTADEFAVYQLWCRHSHEPQGRYHATGDVDDAEASDDDDEDVPMTEQYTVKQERVNLSNIRKYMDLVGSRSWHPWDDGPTLFELLAILLLRAVDNGDGTGTITVIVRESRCAPGMKGRRHSGVHNLPTVPKECRRELGLGVSSAHMGHSVFSMPKVVKWIARFGISVDLDCQRLLQLHVGRGSNLWQRRQGP